MRMATWSTLAIVIVLSSKVSLAQQGEPTNPLHGNAQAIDQGQQLFRLSCASCHGLNAKGLRGPDLTTGQWIRGGSDAQLFRTIMQGIPGTDMPGAQIGDATSDQVWAVIAYLRTLSGPASEEDKRGNAQNGETLFWGKATCGQCPWSAAAGDALDLTSRESASAARERR